MNLKIFTSRSSFQSFVKTLSYWVWCAEYCNENKDFYYFSQSKRFACVKECGKKPKNNNSPQFNKGDFPQNLFRFQRNFCLDGTELGNDSNYR